MRRTENVQTAGDTSRVPPGLTKEPVQMVAGRHKGEYGASVEPLISRQARGVPAMLHVKSAYLAGGSSTGLAPSVLVSTAPEQETTLDAP